jgi:hypothetical protein
MSRLKLAHALLLTPVHASVAELTVLRVWLLDPPEGASRISIGRCLAEALLRRQKHAEKSDPGLVSTSERVDQGQPPRIPIITSISLPPPPVPPMRGFRASAVSPSVAAGPVAASALQPAQKKAIEFDVQMLVDERKQVRTPLPDPAKRRSLARPCRSGREFRLCV